MPSNKFWSLKIYRNKALLSMAFYNLIIITIFQRKILDKTQEIKNNSRSWFKLGLVIPHLPTNRNEDHKRLPMASSVVKTNLSKVLWPEPQHLVDHGSQLLKEFNCKWLHLETTLKKQVWVPKNQCICNFSQPPGCSSKQHMVKLLHVVPLEERKVDNFIKGSSAVLTSKEELKD